MPSNTFRPVACHQPDHKPARYRDQQREPAQLVSRRRHKHRAYTAEVEGVCEEGDQAQKPPRYERADEADADSEQRDRNHPRGCGEIAQLFRIVFVILHRDATFRL